MNFSILVLILGLSCTQAFSPLHSTSSSMTRKSKVSMAFNFNLDFLKGGSSNSQVKIPANKQLCVITGTTSGLGKATLRALLDMDNYYVISACRDVEKMKQIGEAEGFDSSKYSVLELDLASFESTRRFVTKLNAFKGSRPIDRLVCNAAVYQPALDKVITTYSYYYFFIFVYLNLYLNIFLNIIIHVTIMIFVSFYCI